MPPTIMPPVAVPQDASPFPINPALQEAIDESISFGATIHPITSADYPVLGHLHDQVFGPGALTRTAYRVREGLPRHSAHCRLARDKTGTIIAFIRFAPVRIGGQGGALMLGPLAVASSHANQGHARRLIAEGLTSAAAAGIRLIVLVGDLPYYGRIGFKPVPLGQITMPGPVDLNRMLVLELRPGELAKVRGCVTGNHTDLR
jgi:predicted N-acetyltransferase YhbS